MTVQIGYVCQRWDMNYPTRTGQNDALPQINDRDHNFCRNPDNDPNGPWCYAFSKSWGKVKLLYVSRITASRIPLSHRLRHRLRNITSKIDIFRHIVIFHSVLVNQITKSVRCKRPRKCLKCKLAILLLNCKLHFLVKIIKCNQMSDLCQLIFR